MVLSSWHSHCESSPGSFNECRLSARWSPTLRPNQPIWAVSPPIGCYHPQTPSPFYYYSDCHISLYAIRGQKYRKFSSRGHLAPPPSAPIPAMLQVLRESVLSRATPEIVQRKWRSVSTRRRWVDRWVAVVRWQQPSASIFQRYVRLYQLPDPLHSTPVSSATGDVRDAEWMRSMHHCHSKPYGTVPCPTPGWVGLSKRPTKHIIGHIGDTMGWGIYNDNGHAINFVSICSALGKNMPSQCAFNVLRLIEQEA